MRRTAHFFPVITLSLAGLALCGCAAIATREAKEEVQSCIATAWASVDGQTTATWIWRGQETSANKLNNGAHLTAAQKDALVAFRAQTAPCKQRVLQHDYQYAAWEAPYDADFFAKTESIAMALIGDQLTIGQANRFLVEVQGQFQTALAKAHAEAVSEEQQRQQQAAEAYLRATAAVQQASAPYMLHPLPTPTTTTTNCYFIGNNLNCTSSSH